MISWSLVKYVLSAAVRDKLIISLLLAIVLVTSLSIFMGSAAITEKDQFAVVYTAGSLRLAGILGLVLFVVFFIRRSFETKDVEYLLSRPIGRVQFLLSYSVGFSILAVFLVFSETIALYALGPHLFNESHLLWSFSILIEAVIIVNIALFFSMILSSAASAAMAVFAFYALGRMMGEILGIIQAEKGTAHESMEFVMQVVSVIVPRMDLMGQTSWLIYGQGDQIGYIFVLLQALVYIPLILLACFNDLARRQF